MYSSCPDGAVDKTGIIGLDAVSPVCAELQWTPAVAVRLLEALDILVTTRITTQYQGRIASS